MFAEAGPLELDGLGDCKDSLGGIKGIFHIQQPFPLTNCALTLKNHMKAIVAT